jgi:DNA-binding CsgD family transcriptional regulator
VNEEEYRRARRAFIRTGRPEKELLELLRQVARRFVRRGGLPPMYSPTGQWDEQAEEEILADWAATRLVRGQLARMLHDAGTPSAFARLAEAALRNHALDRLERTQAGNLFARLRKMLPADPELILTHQAKRDQDKAWGLRSLGDSRSVWTGDDSELIATTWGLGEFDTVVHRDDARKLSPLLKTPELRRFVHELLAAVEAPLTLSQLMRALVLRFDLEPVALEELDAEVHQPPTREPAQDEQVTAERAAIAALTELTGRQVEVLRLQLGRSSTRDTAAELSISVGTVQAERNAISAVLRHYGQVEDASNPVLLNKLREMLFLTEQTR